MPASAYASYAASTIMSSRDWSQFSPNWHAPTPTTATLSRIDSAISLDLCLDGTGLPEIVRLAARVVDLAEHVLDGLLERDVGGPHVRHLDVDPAAVDLGHNHDRGRLRGREEVVERVREQPAAPALRPARSTWRTRAASGNAPGRRWCSARRGTRCLRRARGT